MTSEQSLSKAERVSSKIAIDELFNGGHSCSMAAFPLRIVWQEKERQDGEPQAQLLISVPKKFLRRAVKRNRAKRQIREAYRRHKILLTSAMNGHADRKVVVALIWLDSRLHSSAHVERKVESLLQRLSEKL